MINTVPSRVYRGVTARSAPTEASVIPSFEPVILNEFDAGKDLLNLFYLCKVEFEWCFATEHADEDFNFAV